MSSRILYSSGRIVFVQFILLIGFCALLGRLVYLQIYQDVFLDDQVFTRLDSQYSLLAPRGKILDRNDNILALDIKGYSVGLDLEKFIYDPQTIVTLSNILNKNPITLSKSLEGRLSGYKEISRNVNLETKENLKDMKVSGLYFRENLRRSYPEKDIISHVVGLTDIDRKGIQGVELIFKIEKDDNLCSEKYRQL